MKILVLGAGGREHAIVWALKQTSHSKLDLYCAPGNAGIAELAQCIPVPTQDQTALVQFAQSEKMDLTFVGPEAPLAEGIVDRFQSRGLRIAGPSMAAAKLESSKVLAKDFMTRHRIPTAAYQVAGNYAETIEILRRGEVGGSNRAVVLKADGLAAGKGVVVARTRDEAERAASELTSGRLVGADAAKQIIVEEGLEGSEVSVLIFTDGRDYQVMPAARDHKRIGENDTGPNTGGMGAVTDNSLLDQNIMEQIKRLIIEPTLEGARVEGFPFRGVLFVGLMLTKDGPRVLEYNVRFGDPETQAILVRLESDLAAIFNAIADETLGSVPVVWSQESSACVVLATRGYPGKYEAGAPISGLSNISSRVRVFHAGTARTESGQLVTAGGRVLGVTATGPTLENALTDCYNAVSHINWDGMQFRRDIGRHGSGVAA